MYGMKQHTPVTKNVIPAHKLQKVSAADHHCTPQSDMYVLVAVPDLARDPSHRSRPTRRAVGRGRHPAQHVQGRRGPEGDSPSALDHLRLADVLWLAVDLLRLHESLLHPWCHRLGHPVWLRFLMFMLLRLRAGSKSISF